MLAPAVRECDRNVAACASAQADLTGHIDRLSHELEILVASIPEHASLAEHATRVKTIKTRVNDVETRIRRVKERVRTIRDEAFAMRRANLVRVAAEPMDELPARREVMYRIALAEEDDDDRTEPKRAERGKKTSPSASREAGGGEGEETALHGSLVMEGRVEG